MATISEEQKQLTLTRIFDAPRELVFNAWTDPAHLKQWWGPKNFTNPVCEIDARPGGAIRIHMQGPDGTIYPTRGLVKEVAEPERLVFTLVALDNNGNAMFENINTITFAAEGNKTTLTLHVQVTNIVNEEMVAPMIGGMEQGWSQSLDRLDAFIVNI